MKKIFYWRRIFLPARRIFILDAKYAHFSLWTGRISLPGRIIKFAGRLQGRQRVSCFFFAPDNPRQAEPSGANSLNQKDLDVSP
jgi:hypothetical protein